MKIKHLKNLTTHRFSTIFLIIGIWIGTNILCFNLSYSESLKNKDKIIELDKKNYYNFMITNRQKLISIKDNILSLKNDYYVMIKKELMYNDEKYNLHGIGFEDGSIYSPKTKGKFFSVDDINNSNSVAIVGKNVKHNIYIDDNKEYIDIKDKSFKVIGISEDINNINSISIPINNFLSLFIEEEIMDFQWLVASKANSITDTPYKLMKGINDSFDVIDLSSSPYMPSTILLSFISALVILVAIINIINFTFIWIDGRKKEIALRKAIGATNLEIRIMIFKEIFTLTLISLLLTLITQWSINSIINRLNIIDFYLSISLKNIIFLSFMTLVISIISSIPSCKKAIRFNPAILLKEE